MTRTTPDRIATASDRELLELAAKAAGITINDWKQRGPVLGECALVYGALYSEWNPLTCDGDALRLAVKLRLDLCRPQAKHEAICVWVDHMSDFIEEPHGDDAYAATRRVIVRAAAATGAPK